jgi:hypothetical protein
VNINLLELFLAHGGCRPVVWSTSASGRPLVGTITRDGRRWVVKGGTAEQAIKELCARCGVVIPPEPLPPPSQAYELTSAQWDGFLAGMALMG